MPHPVDVHVGKQIRHRRWLTGMTQQQLAEAVGIKFQQIQKYEKGTNRVGASRLQAIASVLSAPVSYFFEGAPGEENEAGRGMAEDGADFVVDFLNSSEGVQLNRAFAKISDPKVRRRIIDLVKVLATDNQD